MTSRELQNDLRRAQNELGQLSRTPPKAAEDPQRSPKAALSQILHACAEKSTPPAVTLGHTEHPSPLPLALGLVFS